jgi:hypothetical protein
MKKEIEKLVRSYERDINAIEKQIKNCSTYADKKYRQGKINQLNKTIDDLKYILEEQK